MPTTDVTAHFQVLGLRRETSRCVSVELTPQMYHPAEDPLHHWLYFTFLGFQRLQDVLDDLGVSELISFCDIGTSSGLDAIGAWEVLRPQTMILTDILADIINSARLNVVQNCHELQDKNLQVFDGDLAEPLRQRGLRTQVVYANLPTLPYGAHQEDINKEGDLAASFYPRDRLGNQPQHVSENLLELYYSLLKQVRELLDPPGIVICPIGGRRLWNPIEQIFTECGFKASLLVFDIKPQEQAERCLPVYRDHERDNGVRFHFLPYDQAKRLRDDTAEERGGEESISDPVSLRAFHDDLLPKLELISISAADAVDMVARGERVGHIVYVVMGKMS